MNPIQFADIYLKPYKISGNDEINVRDCPFCGGESKDKFKFYVNRETGVYKCHRNKCGAQGSFIELQKKFGVDVEKRDVKASPSKTYNPAVLIEQPSDTVIDYLATRKISVQTIRSRQIGESKGNIVFPFHDERGKLQLLKYRPARKLKKGDLKSWAEPGGKGILFGMNLCDPEKPLVITEGELDSCSLTESGIPNAVSVPNGASDFSWVDNCWDWLKKFKKIIVFGDNDKVGEEMVKEIVKKLGEDRCFIVRIEDEEIKDANELLYYEGVEGVRRAVDSARLAPVEGLIDLSDVVPVESITLPKIRSHLFKLDKAIGGFYLGELSVWTGKRKEGKSTLLSQLMVEAVNDGHPVCAYSGELTSIRFQDWLHKQIAGESFIKSVTDAETGKEYYILPREVHDKVRNWYKGKFYLYDNTINFDNIEESSIIRIFTYAAKRYGCKMFLVDNLMTAPMHATTERNFYRRQGLFVGELVRFAKSFNVHIHLVAHPRKAESDDDNDAISGSSEIPDRADNIFKIKRMDDGEFDTVLTITKKRSEGIQDLAIGLMFDTQSKRFYQQSDPKGKNKMYGWDYVSVLPDLHTEAPWDMEEEF